jgi:arylsulfatase A-like enzyme
MACITELASGYSGYPGYNGVVPFENGFLSEMLLSQGYRTFMVGKWHLTPSNQETAAGPYDRWPLARGFERFYGFLGGDTSQWYPDLVYDNHQVEPPATPEQGYHLTQDLVDKSIEFIADAKQIDPDKPFYLHLCFGDDTGFGQLGCYGSPIATPNFDALAAGGLRYNNMHTTALCSPSRSCIVTGRKVRRHAARR